MKKLKELRKALGLTQKEVAQKAGIMWQVYQKYELKDTIPSAVTACKIAAALQTTVEAIWGDENQKQARR